MGKKQDRKVESLNIKIAIPYKDAVSAFLKTPPEKKKPKKKAGK